MTAHIPEAIDNSALPSDRATQATPQAPSGLGHPMSVTSADEWIEWNGGLHAPADWDGGEVKFRDGTIGHTSHDHTPKDSVCWQDDDMPEDIVAYRAVKS